MRLLKLLVPKLLVVRLPLNPLLVVGVILGSVPTSKECVCGNVLSRLAVELQRTPIWLMPLSLVLLLKGALMVRLLWLLSLKLLIVSVVLK